MNKRQRDFWLPQIIETYGTDLCIRCGNAGEEIHHINGDDTDNRIENLCLLCHGCNNLRKLQKKNLPVSRRDYTPEHKKNMVKEPLFRKWLEGKLLENNGHYSMDNVIDEGAFYTDVSTETIKRYLSKLCDHPSSPYLSAAGTFGQIDVWFRKKAPQPEKAW